MKKKIVSMALMVVLCFVLAMSAFAEGVQYKIGDYVAYSGHTDFGYYFTYSVEKTNTNYKCFSVVEKWAACVCGCKRKSIRLLQERIQ